LIKAKLQRHHHNHQHQDDDERSSASTFPQIEVQLKLSPNSKQQTTRVARDLLLRKLSLAAVKVNNRKFD